jgi:enoyl-CoA hydratase/carnithine racemase
MLESGRNAAGRRKGRRMEATTAGHVDYDCADKIATITLNRPEKLNAFNDDLVRALAAALHRFDLDPAAEVAILCGHGRAFSSGADVQQRQLRSREEFEALGGPQARDAHSADLFGRAVNWKPVIAAPHGYAMGLALGIVFECDLVVAAAGTRFQITETPRGLGGARYWALLNFRGAGAFAAEVALSGRFFTAEEALAAGLVNRVAPAGRHFEAARELAREVAKNPPLSVRATVRTRRWYQDRLLREVMMQTAPLKLYLTEDFREAARAFAEKRPPGPFKGR